MARTRDELEIVWSTITRDVRRFSGEYGLSNVNSKRWTKIDDTMQELAGLLVEEFDGHAGEPDLVQVTETIWQDIHDKLLAWAEAVEIARDEHRKAAAA